MTEREALISVTASLAAAVSILERSPKAKMAVPSNKMFDQMLDDYRKSLEIGRAALRAQPASPLHGRMLDQANYKIGAWLSAALEDPNVCAEMKADINAWFEAHNPGAQPEYFSGCQLRGPGECQSRGMCLSDACQYSGKVIVTRKCVEPKVDGILYPRVENV